CLWSKAWQSGTEVSTVEGRAGIYFPGKKSLAQRAVGDKADPQLFQCLQQSLFRTPEPEGIFILDCSDRLDGMSVADRLDSGFRQAEMFDLTFLDQILHCSSHIFDRHIRVNT